MNSRAYSILLLASLTLGSQPVKANSLHEKFLGVGVALGITGLTYWHTKPVDPATLKARLEQTYEETRDRYYRVLHSGNERTAAVRLIGSSYQLDFWKSIFTTNDSKLGYAAQINAPLLRGVSLMYYDAGVLQELLIALDNRFGSRVVAQREFANHEAVTLLIQKLQSTAMSIENSSEYRTADDAFKQGRGKPQATEDIRYR